MPDVTLAQATQQYVALLGELTSLKTSLADWAAGTIIGGSFGDGRYPFTMPDGTVVHLPSVAFLRGKSKFLEEFGISGAPGASPTANTAAWEAMLASGAYQGVILRGMPFARYRFAKRLQMRAGMTLIGAPGPAAPQIIFGNDRFNSKIYAWAGVTGTGGDQTTGISIWGGSDPAAPITDVWFEGFCLTGLAQDGRWLRALSVVNAERVVIRDIEIRDMPAAIGLHVCSTRRSFFERIWCHDFYSNVNDFSSQPNISGIEVDNDKVADSAGNRKWSMHNRWAQLRIENMVAGPAYVAKYQDQTDCLNDQGSLYSQYVDVYGSNADEIFDIWSVSNHYSDLMLIDARSTGVKIMYGARENTFDNISITRSGKWGIVMAGNPAASAQFTSSGGPTRANRFSKMMINQPKGIAAYLDDGNQPLGIVENHFEGVTINCVPQTERGFAGPGGPGSYGNIIDGLKVNDPPPGMLSYFQTQGGKAACELAQLTATRDAIMLARTTLDGKAIGTVVTEVRTVTDSAIESLSLLGAKNGAGTAWLLNLGTVLVDGGKTLSQYINSVSASNGDANAAVTILQEALIDPVGGASAKAVLSLTANGRVAGMVATNTGASSKVDFDFDGFRIFKPDGTLLFQAGNGTPGDNSVYMPNVMVDRLAINTAMVPSFWTLPAPVTGNGFGDSTGGTIGTGAGGNGGGGGYSGGGGGIEP